MEVIQILAIVFALFAFSRAVLRFKDGHITAKEFFLWSFVWIAVIVVAVLPSTVDFVSKLFGVQSAIDLIVYVSIIMMFYLIFRLYVKIEKQEHAVSTLTRAVAIKQAKK